ncbi:MAG: GTP pyrophosphokinase [Janthinobacterium lividum]
MEHQSALSLEEFRHQYTQRKPQYERLAANLQQALKTFLSEKNIPYLEVLSRVKDVESAYEKITRKGYEQPFTQIEDWCGLRVICYYASDIDRICGILKEEFAIQTQENTAQRLASNEFGYRSTHLILKVKPEWTVTPNYRGLQEIKAEVQVRTILMHAWAEVEHKLAYKSVEQAPDEFRRKLSLLSAKFEEADGQFEDLRKGIQGYQATIREAVKDVPNFRNQELNLDTLQAFLDGSFSKKERNAKDTIALLDDLLKTGLTMQEIIDTYDSMKHSIPIIERIFDKSIINLTQAGHLKMILDVGSDKHLLPRYVASIKENTSLKWQKAIKEARIAVGKAMPFEI